MSAFVSKQYTVYRTTDKSHRKNSNDRNFLSVRHTFSILYSLYIDKEHS